MTSIGFGLTAEYDGTVDRVVDGETITAPAFSGGVIRAGERDVNLGELLEAGGGVIVVDDSDVLLIDALTHVDALKRVAVPDGAPTLSSYRTATLAALRDEARRRGLDGVGRANKDALIAALEDHDQRIAGGDQAVNVDAAIDPAGGGIVTDDDTVVELPAPADRAARGDKE